MSSFSIFYLILSFSYPVVHVYVIFGNYWQLLAIIGIISDSLLLFITLKILIFTALLAYHVCFNAPSTGYRSQVQALVATTTSTVLVLQYLVVQLLQLTPMYEQLCVVVCVHMCVCVCSRLCVVWEATVCACVRLYTCALPVRTSISLPVTMVIIVLPSLGVPDSKDRYSQIQCWKSTCMERNQLHVFCNHLLCHHWNNYQVCMYLCLLNYVM